MITKGQVYKSKRSNKEYYQVVDIDDLTVNTMLFDLAGNEAVKEKRVSIFLPHFEEAFSLRSAEELALKLLSRI